MSSPTLGTSTSWTINSSSNGNYSSANNAALNFSQSYQTPNNATLLVVTLTTDVVISDIPTVSFGSCNVTGATASTGNVGTSFSWVIENPNGTNTLSITDSNKFGDVIVTVIPVMGSRRVGAIGNTSVANTNSGTLNQSITTSRNNSTILAIVECENAYPMFTSNSSTATSYGVTTTNDDYSQGIAYDTESSKGTTVNYSWYTNHQPMGDTFTYNATTFTGILLEVFENTYSIA